MLFRRHWPCLNASKNEFAVLAIITTSNVLLLSSNSTEYFRNAGSLELNVKFIVPLNNCVLTFPFPARSCTEFAFNVIVYVFVPPRPLVIDVSILESFT